MMKKQLFLIAAVAENNVIGKNNDLVWKIKDDMAFFKKTTQGAVLLMGRKNFESIPEKYRPLPNRVNCILTNQKKYIAPTDCPVFSSIEDWIEAYKNDERELFIIGGGQVFKEALDKKLVDVMYYTEVQANPDGDVFFPEIDTTYWKDEIISQGMKNMDNEFDFVIHRYTKRDK
jgi:dihydrofolate reductase